MLKTVHGAILIFGLSQIHTKRKHFCHTCKLLANPLSCLCYIWINYLVFPIDFIGFIWIPHLICHLIILKMNVNMLVAEPS